MPTPEKPQDSFYLLTDITRWGRNLRLRRATGASDARPALKIPIKRGNARTHASRFSLLSDTEPMNQNHSPGMY
jgi:hypothetical protein